MTTAPDLIVPTEPLEPSERDGYDLYLPAQGGRRPVVVLVHGLFQEPPPVTPRRTAFFRAYAAQLARRGAAAVVLDHELTGGMRYPEAAATLDRVLAAVRTEDRVDPDAVAVWVFSGGGPLAFPLLAADHGWLRCVALTYPLLPTEDIPGWPSLADAVRGLGATPLVLTLVEHELPGFGEGQQALLAAAPPALTTIRVAAAQHGFDTGPGSDEHRAAVKEALDAVAGHLLAAPSAATDETGPVAEPATAGAPVRR